MSKKLKWIIGILVVVVLIGGWFVGYYNRFIAADQAVVGQWAQVETSYQRRFDLIPNVVEATKGIFEQERAVFGAIAEARARYSGARTVEDKVAAANQVESALARLLAIVENYPQLKSSEVVQTLITELEGTENRISVERRRFNETVQSYNVLTKRFPGNLMARLFGFGEKAYFESAEGAETAPKVDLNLTQ